MTYTYAEPNFTSSGLDEILTDIGSSVSIFIPMVLVFIFSVIFITGYRRQKRETGFGDAPLWATLAGISTTMIALLMSLATDMITLSILSVTVAVTIVCGIWLFFSRDR